jgi:hypothetical protein
MDLLELKSQFLISPVEEKEIELFLQDHLGLAELIPASIPFIFRSFPESTKPTLRYIENFDGGGDSLQILISVKGELGVSCGLSRLDIVDELWWMNLPRELRMLITTEILWV